MMRLALALTLLLLPGCASLPAGGPADAGRLATWFDCLRSRNEAVISAHRGGPAPGLPENALETMAVLLLGFPDALLEIDVQASADGVLFLLHDDRLDRTTTGTGRARDLSWDQLAQLNLRDNRGIPTLARIPRLADALAFARAQDAVVQLDIKRGVDFAAVVAAVRAARAERHVIIITYRDADALAVARLAPDLMVSATVASAAAAETLIAGGLARDRLLAWTGIETPDPGLYADLRTGGIEPMFGTLGRPGERWDDRWLADGDAREFVALERDGVVVIATDRPVEVAEAIGPPSCRR